MPYIYGTDDWERAYLEMAERRMEEEPKPYAMGTPEWVASLEGLTQGDAAYKEAAKDWEGTVTLCFLAKPEVGIDADFHILMDLWHGDCRSMRLVPREEGGAAEFVITGEYDIWKSVMAGELHPVKGMMEGKLKLKGSMPTMVRYVKANTRMVELVGKIGTRFPDEMSEDERETFQRMMKGFREEFSIRD